LSDRRTIEASEIVARADEEIHAATVRDAALDR